MEKPSHKQTGTPISRVTLAVVTGSGIVCAAIYFLNFKLHALVAGLAGLAGPEFYVVIFLLLSALYLAAVVLVLKAIPAGAASRFLIGIILIFAVIFRISLVPAAPNVLSGDMYRYIWDGPSSKTASIPTATHPAHRNSKPCGTTGFFRT